MKLLRDPLLLAIVAAALAVAARWTRGRDSTQPLMERVRPRAWRSLYRTAPLWVFFILYWFLAIQSHMNIGHRHILPTYPMMFIFCGAAAYWFHSRYKAARAAILVALGLLVVDSVAIYPHYLAYFNQLVGPRNAYRHLVDSSLDWGQDLPGLKRWLAQRQDPTMKDKPVYLSYFGTGNPEHYGLETEHLPGYFDWRSTDPVPLEAGTYCISASMLPSLFLDARGNWTVLHEVQYKGAVKDFDRLKALTEKDPSHYENLLSDPTKSQELAEWNRVFGKYDQLRAARLFAYLRQREPDDAIGYSILIYYLDEEDLDRALNQPIEFESE